MISATDWEWFKGDWKGEVERVVNGFFPHGGEDGKCSAIICIDGKKCLAKALVLFGKNGEVAEMVPILKFTAEKKSS